MSYTIATSEDILKKQRYIAKIKGWDFWARRDEIIRWCNEQFGAHTPTFKNPRWSSEDSDFHFKYEQDLMLFVMRWS